MKVLIYYPSGNKHMQIDDISIGSLLGPTISKFHMSQIEKNI